MSTSNVISRTLKPLTNIVSARVTGVSDYFARADRDLSYAEQMTDPKKPLRVGAAIIVLTFVGFGGWAALAPIDSAAVAPGVVVVESNRRVIQHLEGGIVHDILVDDGSVVKKGDVLVRLDDTRARAQLAILQSDLDSSMAIEARLIAERDGLAQPNFPAELTARDKDPAVHDIIQGQINLFNARKAAIDSQKAVLNQRIEQYREQKVGLEALRKSKEIQLRTIKDELNGLAGLLEEGYVTKPRVLALQREAARLEGEMGDHVATIARTDQGIGETRMQMIQLEKQRQEEVARDLRETQSREAESREKVVAAEDVMRRIDVVAPVSGTVMNLQVHTKGGVVGPGAGLMEIVPDADTLVIEAQINPMDIDSVHPGQEVAIHISVVDSRLTPVIYGTLDNVSADRITDPRTGMPYYKGRVLISQKELDRLGDHKLHSGMQVEAMIERGQQTALYYALKPLLDSLDRSFKEK